MGSQLRADAAMDTTYAELGNLLELDNLLDHVSDEAMAAAAAAVEGEDGARKRQRHEAPVRRPEEPNGAEEQLMGLPFEDGSPRSVPPPPRVHPAYAKDAEKLIMKGPEPTLRIRGLLKVFTGKT